MTKWQSFIKELSNLLFFWFTGIVFFAIFRICFISIFHKQMTDVATFGEIMKTMGMGFRFDCTVISYFIVVPLLMLLTLAYFGKFKTIKRIRIVFQWLFAILSVIICVVTLNYFREYHAQFNYFLFLSLYDDQKAVLKTIIEDFHPILNLVAIIVSIIALLLIFRYFENRNFIYSILNRIKFKGSKVIIVIMTIGLCFCGFRGSLYSTPAIRKWAAVSRDAFLNKTIMNPYRSLKYAISDFNEINKAGDKNPYLSADEFKNIYTKELVTDYLKKHAGGALIEKPRQIFIVVMESYDSWPLMDKYLPLKLSSNLDEIRQNGTSFYNFLPAGNATFESFAAIVTDVPYVGINISQLGAMNECFKTSIFTQFKKLGYQTNLFYGGFVSWENIGEFCKNQGIDHVFSGVNCGGKPDKGSWGVEDEKLFDMVLSNTDTTVNSLNIILTSSYHGPYTIDVYGKGFPYKSPNDFPTEMQKYYDGAMTMKQLGHLWYGDKAIGDFMRTAKTKYSTGLFCFTGDHYGRRFINHHPNLYEHSSVPFIMYGKNIPVAKYSTPGSHIDIMPTIIEMIAPKGFVYYSFGKSMFDANKTTAFAFEKMINGNEMFYFPKDADVQEIDTKTFNQTQVEKIDLMPYKKIMAFAWHYTMKGLNLNGDSIQIIKDQAK